MLSDLGPLTLNFAQGALRGLNWDVGEFESVHARGDEDEAEFSHSTLVRFDHKCGACDVARGITIHNWKEGSVILKTS
jgi:hypothetical protein